jgi:NAD(P)-dependent dehydrogenase (short-subunit alcohol dehydrogenase family)
MVNIKDVRVSNADFKASKPSVVAVFVGATSGIGLATVKHLAAAAVKPTIYILGRSKSSASPLLDELAKINPQATVNFIETEISLIKNIDKACEEIVSKEKKVDLLFLSPGGVSLGGRDGKCCRVPSATFISLEEEISVTCLHPVNEGLSRGSLGN